MTNPFTNPDYLWNRNLPIKDIKQPADLPKVESRTQASLVVPVTKGFGLEDLTDCWRIHGVSFGSDVYTVDLAKELLAGGARKTQDDWLAYSNEAAKKNEFHVVSAPAYHAGFRTLFKHKDDAQHKDLIGKIRTYLAATFQNTWVSTLSRVLYLTSHSDMVKHFLPSKDVPINVVGSTGYVTKMPCENECNALLGDTTQNINETYQWLTGKNTYLWRRIQKPEQTDPRAVVLGVIDADSFNLGADDDLISNRPALGVRLVQKISTGNGGGV